MKMIVHQERKYGYFVGYAHKNPVWQPVLRKAIKSFRMYLGCRPSTNVEKELESLNKLSFLTNKVSIIEVNSTGTLVRRN